MIYKSVLSFDINAFLCGSPKANAPKNKRADNIDPSYIPRRDVNIIRMRDEAKGHLRRVDVIFKYES